MEGLVGRCLGLLSTRHRGRSGMFDLLLPILIILLIVAVPVAALVLAIVALVRCRRFAESVHRIELLEAALRKVAGPEPSLPRAAARIAGKSPRDTAQP